MKYFFGIIALFMLTGCQTKYNIIDTGLANGNFKGTMYEYFKADRGNWDSLCLIIERANLVDLFEGKREGFEQITFFGPVNYSILRWMLDNNYPRVSRIPVNICREMVMRHIVTGKRLMRNDIPRGTPGNGAVQGTGGTTLTGALGNSFWIYSFQGDYEGIPGIGSVDLFILSLTGDRLRIDIATPDLETTTGTIMALNGTYLFGTL